MTPTPPNPFFAPELIINNGVKDISFYQHAFGATQHLCFHNDDGSIHVAELSINDAIFHIHEVTDTRHFFPATKHNGTTVCIGLFVPDVDAVMAAAIAAGATEITPAQDHDYGYRQAMLKDPFGHLWQIQKKLS